MINFRNNVINTLIKNGFSFQNNKGESEYSFKKDDLIVNYISQNHNNDFIHLIKAGIDDVFTGEEKPIYGKILVDELSLHCSMLDLEELLSI